MIIVGHRSVVRAAQDRRLILPVVEIPPILHDITAETMFTIGKHTFDRPVLLAPMEDVTDMPFRVLCREIGADIVYTEFVNVEGLVRQNERTHRKMAFQEVERPIGIQIYGGNEESMVSGAQLSEQLSPDLIDINCGCWVKDIAMRGAGAGLLRDLPKMERLVGNVVRGVSLPVTVKTRLGWDQDSIRIVEVAQRMEQAGAKALTIHCRTRVQGHKGDPDYTLIPEVKKAVSIPIIVNGGINSPLDAERVFDTTGCDGVMIARAAIACPWIFRETKAYLRTGVMPEPPTIQERFSVMLRQLRDAAEYKDESRAVLEFRKFYSNYLKGLPNAAQVRRELMVPLTVSDVEAILFPYRDRLLAEEQVPVA